MKKIYIYIAFLIILATIVIVCIGDNEGEIPRYPDYHCAYCEEQSLKIRDTFCGKEADCKEWIYWVNQTQKPHGKTNWKCIIK